MSVTRGIIFFYSAYGVAPPSCDKSFFDGDPVDSVFAFLDNHVLPPYVVRKILIHVDYMILHQLLWTKIQRGITPAWGDRGSLLRDKIIELSIRHPSIQDTRTVLAIETDMRTISQVVNAKTHIMRALENFDFPSLFKLELVHNHVREYLGADFITDILDTLLDRKLVAWLRAADIGMILSTERMDVFSHQSGIERIYKMLTTVVTHDRLEILENLGYFPLLALFQHVCEETTLVRPIKDALRNMLDIKLQAFILWQDEMNSSFQINKENVRKFFILARELPTGFPAFSLNILLMVRTIMLTWHSALFLTQRFEPLSLRHKLSLATQYSVESIFLRDLKFLRHSLIVQALSGNTRSTLRNVFQDHKNVVALYDELRLMDPSAIERATQNLDYHFLFQLQQVNRFDDDDDVVLFNIVRDALTQDFDRWFMSGEKNVYLLHLHPLLSDGSELLPLRGWNAFGPESNVFFNPIGARQIYEYILLRPRFHRSREIAIEQIQYLDYFSLLILKDTIMKSDTQSLVLLEAIDKILPDSQILWSTWLTRHASPLMKNEATLHKLVASLRLMPSAKTAIQLSDMAQLLHITSGHMRDQGEEYRFITQLFCDAVKSFANKNFEVIETFLSHKQNVMDLFVGLGALPTPGAVRDSIVNLDYNHLIVLQHAARHRNFQAAHFSLRIQLQRNSARFYHPLKADYILAHLAFDFDTTVSIAETLEFIEYLPLLALNQHASLTPAPFKQKIVDYIPSVKIQWRQWYTQSRTEVVSDAKELKMLLHALLLVPEGEFLLTPPEISNLGDVMRRSYPRLALDPTSVDDGLLQSYLDFVQHIKKCQLFCENDNLCQAPTPDKIFRNHIWLHESDINQIDALTMSVQFDREVLTAHRSALHAVIDWEAVRFHNLRYKFMPNTLRHAPNALTTSYGGIFKFLVDRKRQDGLPSHWFAE